MSQFQFVVYAYGPQKAALSPLINREPRWRWNFDSAKAHDRILQGARPSVVCARVLEQLQTSALYAAFTSEQSIVVGTQGPATWFELRVRLAVRAADSGPALEARYHPGDVASGERFEVGCNGRRDSRSIVAGQKHPPRHVRFA